MKAFVFNLAIFTLSIQLFSGCASTVPVGQQTPIVQYKNTKTLALAIIDSRPYVTNGSSSNSYVGTTIHAFGVHIPRHVHSYLSDDELDDKKPLSVFLQGRLETGLKGSNWAATAVVLATLPTQKMAEDIFNSTGSDRLLVINLTEWRSRFDGHISDKFDFNTAYSVSVFKRGGDGAFIKNMGKNHYYSLSVLAKNNEDATSVRNAIILLTKDELAKIINDPDIREKLTD